MKTITEMNGDLNLDGTMRATGNIRAAGDVSIAGDLRIGGWLDAPNIKNPCRGLFGSVEDLEECCPRPFDGQYAFVGDSFPADLYRAENRSWHPTGGQSPSINVSDLDEDNPTISSLIDQMGAIRESLDSLIESTYGLEYTVTRLNDQLEQLDTDLGKVETAAANAQIDATRAFRIANENSFCYLNFNGFDYDDGGYSGDGTSTAEPVSVLYHSLYGHFEAIVYEAGRRKVVKRWNGAEAYNVYDTNGNIRVKPQTLFVFADRIYCADNNGALQKIN